MNFLERALDNQNQWWKYLVVILAGFVGANLIGAIPLMIVIGIKIYQNGGNIPVEPQNAMDFAAYGIDQNLGLVLMLIPFVLGLVIVALMFKPLHKRTFSEVINGTKKIRWNKFFFATLIWAALMGIYLLVDYNLNPSNFEMNLNISAFIPLIIISVLLLPLQTTFEEVVFRGYLAQGIGAWTKSRWMVIIIPAIFFGLMHSLNPEVKEFGFWVAMPQYIIFGLIFGLTAILDDGIEVAMGAHAANNVFTSIFLTHKASVLQTPALLQQQEVFPQKETIALLVLGILFVVILKSKYKWSFSILNKRVE